MIIERDLAIAVAALDQQADRIAAGVGGGDGAAEQVVGILLAAHRDDRRPRGGADVEHRRIPGHSADPPALADHRSDAEGEIEDLAVLLARLEVSRRRVAIDQPVAAGGDPIERRMRADPVHALVEVGRPVEGRDCVEGRDDVVESVGGDALIARVHAEEGAGEIVHRAAAAAKLSKPGIHLEPDQHAFRIIILAAHPARPGLRAARLDDRVVGRVDQRAPGAAGKGVVEGGGARELVEHVGGRHQAGARGEDIAPELRPPLVDPEQAVAHRHVVIGRPQVRRAAVLAVPAMGELVGQEVASRRARIPVGEIVARVAVLGRAQMLEPDPAELVGQRDEIFVLVEMDRAEQFDFLLGGAAVDGDLLGSRGEVARFVGKQVEVDVLGQPLAPVIAPGEDRGVDQGLVGHGAIGQAVAGSGGDVERGRRAPAGGIGDDRLDRDSAGEIAGRVERHLLPLQVQHVGGHRHPALAGIGRREMLEFDAQRSGALGHVDVEGVDVGGIAPPLDGAAVGGDPKAGDRVDRSARSVIARKPFRIEQGQRPRSGDGDRFDDPVDAAAGVAGVDLEAQGTGIRHVARRGHGGFHRQRLGNCRADLGEGGHGDAGGGGEQDETHGADSERRRGLSKTSAEPSSRGLGGSRGA